MFKVKVTKSEPESCENHRLHLQDTFIFDFVFLPNSLSFDENVLVFRIQHTLTDELLGHRNGHIVGDTEV